MDITFQKFGGLNTNLAPYLLPEGKSPDLYDVTNREGTLGPRSGSVRKNATECSEKGALGLYTHVTEAGVALRMALFAGASYYLTGGVMTSLSYDFGTGPFKCATLRGLTVVAGTSKVSLVKDATTIDALTRDTPSAGTTSAGTGTLANGVYTYWLMYYSTLTGQYGSPLGTSWTYTVTGTTAPSVGRGSNAVSTIWNRIAVLRSTVGGATPLLVALKQDNEFPFNDTCTDANLATGPTITDGIHVADAIDVLVRDDRVFLIRNSDRSVYYSESGKTSMISSLGFLTALGGSETPVAIAATLASIFVLGMKSIWLIAGNTSTTYGMARVVNGIGCVDRRSVQVYNDKIYFKGSLGYYEFDGIDPPGLISTDNDDILRNLANSCPTAVNTQTGEYMIFSKAAAGSSEDDVVYRYDCNTKEWWRDRYPAWCGAMMRSVADDALEAFVTLDYYGFYHEQDQSTYYDGISSGTMSGTATTGGGTTVLPIAAPGFYATGSGLKGCILEVKHGTTIERRMIISNTTTALTANAFSFTITSGDSFSVCSISSLWTSGRVGAGTMNRFKLWEATFEEVTGGTLLLDWAIDAGGFVGTTKTVAMSSVTYARGWVARHGRKIALRIRTRSQYVPFSLAAVVLEAETHVG
jgi:hypothetical protein